MSTNIIPLSEFLVDPARFFRRCCDSSEALVVEMPDCRQVALEPLGDDDDLIANLLEHNEEFRAVGRSSLASGRLPLAARPLGATMADAARNGPAGVP